MNLLHAGVNPIYIRDLLGHADLSTTEIYARTDTELKREALKKAYPDMLPSTLPHWTQDEDLLARLTKSLRILSEVNAPYTRAIRASPAFTSDNVLLEIRGKSFAPARQYCVGGD